MTREQAIKLLLGLGGPFKGNPNYEVPLFEWQAAGQMVDWFVKAGIIKLEQPAASVSARAIDAIYAGAGRACDAVGILRELDDAGLQIVEKSK